MDTTTVDPEDAYNTAIARRLSAEKHDQALTFDALAAKSGVNARTLKRLLHDERPFKMGQFIAIAAALGLDPAGVVAAVEAGTVNNSAQLTP